MGTESTITRAPLLGEPLAVELMNTIWADRAGVHDSLGTPAEAAGWLRAAGHRLAMELPGADELTVELTDRVLRQLRRLRDALRELAAEATEATEATGFRSMAARQAAIAVVNRASALAPAWPELHWTDACAPVRSLRTRGTPAELAVSTLARHGVELIAGPTRSRLRACRAPGCVLYYLQDHPRRAWCSAGCGNRARVARHYRRHHRAAAAREAGRDQGGERP